MRLAPLSCLLMLSLIYSLPAIATSREVHCPDIPFVKSVVEKLDTVQYVKDYQLYHVFTLFDSIYFAEERRNWYMVTTIYTQNYNDAYNVAVGTVATLTQQVDVTPRADDLGYYICEYRNEQRSVYLLSDIYKSVGTRYERFTKKLESLHA